MVTFWHPLSSHWGIKMVKYNKSNNNTVHLPIHLSFTIFFIKNPLEFRVLKFTWNWNNVFEKHIFKYDVVYYITILAAV